MGRFACKLSDTRIPNRLRDPSPKLRTELLGSELGCGWLPQLGAWLGCQIQRILDVAWSVARSSAQIPHEALRAACVPPMPYRYCIQELVNDYFGLLLDLNDPKFFPSVLRLVVPERRTTSICGVPYLMDENRLRVGVSLTSVHAADCLVVALY